MVMEEQNTDIEVPVYCLVCNVSSEGSTYLAFIHAHADCRIPPVEQA